jgi:hypothetical protein
MRMSRVQFKRRNMKEFSFGIFMRYSNEAIQEVMGKEIRI